MFLYFKKKKTSKTRFQLFIKNFLANTKFYKKQYNLNLLISKKLKKNFSFVLKYCVSDLERYNKLNSILLSYIRTSKLVYIGLYYNSKGFFFFKNLFFGFFIGNLYQFSINNLLNPQLYKYGSPILLGIKYNNIFFYNFIYKKKYKIAKMPGTYCKLITTNYTNILLLIKLPSKKLIKIFKYSTVFYGRSANIFFKYIKWGNLKKKETYKKTFSNRGISKNAVDHPNGGRTNIKKPFKNPWGNIAKYNK